MWRDLFELSRAVGGPVHVHVAAAVADLSPAAIRARARREAWWQPFRDVIAPPGTPVDATTWARAALARAHGPHLRSPRPAALTRWSGAAAHGVGAGWPTRVQVVVPVARAPEGGARLEVVRSRTFRPSQVVTVGGLSVLAPPALVRGLAAVADVDALTAVVIDLVQRRRTTLAAIAAEHDRWPTYPGRQRVHEVLARLGAAGRTDSSLELRLREWLTGCGIPLDRGQVEVPCEDGWAIHLDLGIAAIFFGIDATSMLAHSARRHLRVDARRTNELARVGDDWRVLQATWEDLHDPAFLALVREVIGAQAQRHLGVPWPPATGATA